MKRRQYGPWLARIIGAQAHFSKHSGPTMICTRDRLRAMSTGDSNLHAAMRWALEQLDALPPVPEGVEVIKGRIFYTDATGLTRILTAEKARALAEHDSTSAADAVALRDAAERVSA